MRKVILGILLPAFLLLPGRAWAQTATPLTLSNNYFVTGDYVVGGVGLRGLGDATGFAKGTITIPDPMQPNSTAVPPGADIVAAFLYWETVESSTSAFAGQNGFFNHYAITGAILGNPNAPTSWSSGGCSGASNGSKTMRTYRANVRPYLPVDAKGNVQPNTSFEVRLADSGSNGGGTPLTLGATLVIIYRVLDKNVPLNAVVLYDGALAPSNASSTMSQQIAGFYQPAGSPVAKITHIVGNGQPNKFESVFVNTVNLPSLYASLPPLPGIYNGSWDNPTWNVGSFVNGSVPGFDTSETTSVVPAASNSGCVNWGAVVFSTTVQDSDGDGLLDVWEQNQGYCDATDTSGTCDSTHSSWVALPGAKSGQQDVFVQLDYMCSLVKSDGTCDTSLGQHSHLPDPQVLANLTSAFSAHGINLHTQIGNAIQEQACSDTTDANGNPVYCSFPSQTGVVGWKSGFAFLQYLQPLNPDDPTCKNTGVCARRFQFGRKDSYHYVIFGHALGVPNWTFQDGTLISIAGSGNTATFTTSTPNGLKAGTDRVTVADAISNPNLNGTYLVQTASDNTFTIQIANATTATQSTDPHLSVASSHIGTGSGFSDVGGANSLITLGQWGADGQTVPVQSGTFMHELGHSVALTHGGYYRDTPGSYALTFEPNCKPNLQSVMNYLFQVDLLGPNGVLDYSSQELIAVNESSLGVVTGLTTTNGLPAAYSTTKWYAITPPNGVGTAATRHCDGTPISPTDPNPTMFRVEGATSPILWSNPQDINFNGKIDTSLRGYNDWPHIDLRQIGATGSDFLGGGGAPSVGGGAPSVGGGAPSVGGGAPSVGGGAPSVGGGVGEITFETANSVVRPPKNLTATVTSTSPRFIQLTWNGPSFGQISSYNIYRAANGVPVAPPYASVSGSPLATSFLDKNVTCGPLYTYFVTAVLSDGRESAPSNSVSQKTCAPPYTFTGFFSPLSPAGDSSYSGAFNIGKSVTAKWTLQDSSGNSVGNLNANILLAAGPVPLANGVCPRPNQVPQVFNSTQYPYPIATLYSPTTGAKGNSTFRIATSNNQFIFNWDTTPFTSGCYILELDLDSGQVERTALKLQ